MTRIYLKKPLEASVKKELLRILDASYSAPYIVGKLNDRPSSYPKKHREEGDNRIKYSGIDRTEGKAFVSIEFRKKIKISAGSNLESDLKSKMFGGNKEIIDVGDNVGFFHDGILQILKKHNIKYAVDELL